MNLNYDVQGFNGFTYANAVSYRFPRIRPLKDGVIRIAGLSGYKGPAWASIVRQASDPDCDMFAHFVPNYMLSKDRDPDVHKVLVVREGIGLTQDGLWLLRALLPMRERDLFELGLTNGERNILRLGSGKDALYPPRNKEAIHGSD